MSAATVPASIAVRFSAAYMADHLDMWPNDFNCSEPQGKYKGNVWVAEVTPTQLAEIMSRADCYAAMKGTCDYKENRTYVDGAIRTLEAAKAMGYTYVGVKLHFNGEEVEVLPESRPYSPKHKGVSVQGYADADGLFPSLSKLLGLATIMERAS